MGNHQENVIVEFGQEPSLARSASAVFAAWLLTIGFDAFLHAGLLANLYLIEHPSLLGPHLAFRRIPFGYLSFLILTMSLYWLLSKLRIHGVRAGFSRGLIFGSVVWGAFVLGLYSISTIPGNLLLAWWLGQSIELGIAGGVLSAAQSGVTQKRIWLTIAILFVILIFLTVLLQSSGWAPPIKTIGG